MGHDRHAILLLILNPDGLTHPLPRAVLTYEARLKIGDPLAQTKQNLIAENTSTHGRVLQRKCDCGQHTVAGDECNECAKSKMSLQRKSAGGSDVLEIPPLVHQQLSASGQPLQSDTRALMESRLGHDFSNVRVYTDSEAARSARSVNALAFTVGSKVVSEQDNSNQAQTRARNCWPMS